MSGAAASSPRIAPISSGISSGSPSAAYYEPSSYASGSVFGAFGKTPSFKAPLHIQVVGFTREEEGFVNYEITVIICCFRAGGCFEWFRLLL
jgi:hypothetical protein